LAIGNTLGEAVINLRELTQFNGSLAEMTIAERRSAARITQQRAEIIVAGGQILEGIKRALGIKSLTTCEWSYREGVIIDRLRDWVRVITRARC
jgi:exopolyphosphatase/pppGpp-phosphohydrolase